MTASIALKRAINKIGIPYQVYNPTSGLWVNDGYVKIKGNDQATRPFIKEFFRQAMFTYDSTVATGDIIRMTPGNQTFTYLVVSKTESPFRGEVPRYAGILYLCNLTGTFTRATEVRDPDSLVKTFSWTDYETNVPIVFTEQMFQHGSTEKEDLVPLGFHSNEVYVPERYGLQINDRLVLSVSEYYQVLDITRRRFPNVIAAKVTDDKR